MAREKHAVIDLTYSDSDDMPLRPVKRTKASRTAPSTSDVDISESDVLVSEQPDLTSSDSDDIPLRPVKRTKRSKVVLSDDESEVSEGDVPLVKKRAKLTSSLSLPQNFPVSTLVQLIVLLISTCIAELSSSQVSGVIRTLLSDEDLLTELAEVAGLTFATGLFDVVQSAAPPTLAWFKSLPAALPKMWGVYVLTLKKEDCRPRIYIGSGTGAASGVKARLCHYDTGNTLPMYVEKALEDGFEITHKGLLLWAPIPRPGLLPKLRLLFLRMEGALAFVFWAMRSTKKMVDNARLCPWELDNLGYDGVCSHTAFGEVGKGDHELTEEQLETIAAENKKRNAEREKLYARRPEVKARKSQAADTAEYRAHQAASKSALRSSDAYQANKAALAASKPTKVVKRSARESARQSKNNAAYMKREPEKKKAMQKSRAATCKANALAEKRHYCGLCDKAFGRPADLRDHLATGKHKNAVAAAQSSS